MEPSISTEWVREFVAALHALEGTGDATGMVRQFSPEGSVWNLIRVEPKQGWEEIAAFWERYRSEFQTIHSTFERIIETESQAALEWHAEGTLAQGGKEVAYRGVTLLKHGSRGITEFASYYDPRPFLHALGAEPLVGRQERLAA